MDAFVITPSGYIHCTGGAVIEYVPPLSIGDVTVSCNGALCASPSLASSAVDTEFTDGARVAYRGSAVWFKRQLSDGFTAPAKLLMKVVEMGDGVTLGLTQNLAGTNKTSTLDGAAYRNNDVMYTSIGGTVNNGTELAVGSEMLIDIDPTGNVDIYLDGTLVLDGGSISPTDLTYLAAGQAGHVVLDVYSNLNNQSEPKASVLAAGYVEGLTYDLVLEVGGVQHVLESWVATADLEHVFEYSPTEVAGVTEGNDYTIYVQQSSAGSDNRTVERVITYDDCVQPIVVTGSTSSCTLSSGKRDLSGYWYDTQSLDVFDSDERERPFGIGGDEYIIPKDLSFSWNLSSIFPQELTAPCEIFYKKDDGHMFMGFIPVANLVAGAECRYADTDQWGVQSNAGYGVYGRGHMPTGWKGGPDDEWVIRINAAGDVQWESLTDGSTVDSIIPIPSPFYMYVGNATPVRLNVNGAPISNTSVTEIEFSDPNGETGPYILSVDGVDLDEEFFDSPIQLQGLGGGNIDVTIRAKINDATVSNVTVVNVATC